LGLGLVGNSILGKNPKKKVSEFNWLPLQSGFAGSPNFSKKKHFFKKLRDFKTFFNQILFDHIKKYKNKNFCFISIIYADFGIILI
jgi:hypothetical protein